MPVSLTGAIDDYPDMLMPTEQSDSVSSSDSYPKSGSFSYPTPKKCLFPWGPLKERVGQISARMSRYHFDFDIFINKVKLRLSRGRTFDNTRKSNAQRHHEIKQPPECTTITPCRVDIVKLIVLISRAYQRMLERTLRSALRQLRLTHHQFSLQIQDHL